MWPFNKSDKTFSIPDNPYPSSPPPKDIGDTINLPNKRGETVEIPFDKGFRQLSYLYEKIATHYDVDKPETVRSMKLMNDYLERLFNEPRQFEKQSV